MQNEIFSNKRTTERNLKQHKKQQRTPLEKLEDLIREICDDMTSGGLDESKMVSLKISYDPLRIIELIDQKFSESQIQNLNAYALVGGYMVLGNDESGAVTIKEAKVKYIFKNMDYFKSQNINEEDIIRYARFWSTLLSEKEEKKEKVNKKEMRNMITQKRKKGCDHENIDEDVNNGQLVCYDCGEVLIAQNVR